MNNLERTNERASLELRDVLKMSRNTLSDEDRQKRFQKMLEARTFQKRTANEIRDLILEEIQNYPKSTHAIAKKIGSHPRVVKKHAMFLQQHNVIKSDDIVLFKKTKDGESFTQRNKYWSVVK